MMQNLSQWLVVVGGSAALSLVAKATLIVAAGLMAAWLARRAPASARHLILASTFGALLVLPVALITVPEVAIEVAVPQVANATASQPNQPTPTARAGTGVLVHPDGADDRSSLPAWTMVAALGWVAGSMLILFWLGGAIWRFGRLRRRGFPWPESRAVVAALATTTRLRGPVEILLHEGIEAPATCGWLRPTILMPLDATDWDEADVRRALVHELEHVRRSDWAVNLIAHAICAALWFHPLAWIALRRLRLEAERACDDAVLEGAAQTDYAAQLVLLARRLSAARSQPALAMADRGELSTRVSAILDATQRRGRLGAMTAAAALVIAVATVVAVAPVRAVGVYAGKAAVLAAQDGNPAGPLPRRPTPLDLGLFEAAQQEDLQQISALITAGANVNGVVLGDGSPLIAAARNGRRAAVALLLDQGADPNMMVRGDGNPIIMAAREGHTDVVDLLLSRGANIDQIAPGDENALIQASGNGQLAAVKLLVARHADVNARVRVERTWLNGALQPVGEWRTPLRMARRGGHEAVVAYLLSVGAQE